MSMQTIDSPELTNEERSEISGNVLARTAINLLLDGRNPNKYIVPHALGEFADCYEEMLEAYDQDGAEGARAIFYEYAERDVNIAALRGADPALQKRVWTVQDLYETEFPEVRFVVPGILPAGLVALGARPKIGKSWMGLQLSVAVGTAGEFFGHQIEHGKVLYLAFEDSPRRMRSRLQKQESPASADITFGFSWRPLTGEGTADLVTAIDRDKYTLVVIDTLARSLGFVDPNKQAEMNLHLGVLQRIAIDRNMTILLIDHHRKGNGGEGDVIDDLIGATSKSGVVDAALGLYRNRGERNAKLKITGRDIEENEFAVQFSRDTGRWECLGDSETVAGTEQEDAILEAVAQLGAPSHKEISDATGQDRSNTYRRIQELVTRGELRRVDGRPARFIINEEKPKD